MWIIWAFAHMSSSSFNNIQDQCLIITDIYGVWKKGVVAELFLAFAHMS